MECSPCEEFLLQVKVGLKQYFAKALSMVITEQNKLDISVLGNCRTVVLKSNRNPLVHVRPQYT